jgi:hypothetical protein
MNNPLPAVTRVEASGWCFKQSSDTCTTYIRACTLSRHCFCKSLHTMPWSIKCGDVNSIVPRIENEGSRKHFALRIKTLLTWCLEALDNEQMPEIRTASSGMLCRVALVRTDVSEELSASIIRLTRIGELGTTIAVTSNRRCEEISSQKKQTLRKSD